MNDYDIWCCCKKEVCAVEGRAEEGIKSLTHTWGGEEAVLVCEQAEEKGLLIW